MGFKDLCLPTISQKLSIRFNSFYVIHVTRTYLAWCQTGSEAKKLRPVRSTKTQITREYIWEFGISLQSTLKLLAGQATVLFHFFIYLTWRQTLCGRSDFHVAIPVHHLANFCICFRKLDSQSLVYFRIKADVLKHDNIRMYYCFSSSILMQFCKLNSSSPLTSRSHLHVSASSLVLNVTKATGWNETFTRFKDHFFYPLKLVCACRGLLGFGKLQVNIASQFEDDAYGHLKKS